MNEKTNKENLEEKLHSVYQSKILLSHLVNMNSCISSAKENTKEAIKEKEDLDDYLLFKGSHYPKTICF